MDRHLLTTALLFWTLKVRDPGHRPHIKKLAWPFAMRALLPQPKMAPRGERLCGLLTDALSLEIKAQIQQFALHARILASSNTSI